MTTPSQSNLRFFERAQIEARRYGKDPWVFLRELVQNSRDAGATHIWFATAETKTAQTITCTDDGKGMTRPHIERYLFRLFASDKEDQEDLIGFFGVGFWSILLFGPRTIRIESRHRNQSAAFEVDCATDTVREIPSQLGHDGTRISLIRPSPKRHSRIAFGDEVQAHLSHYAAHVRSTSTSKNVTLLCNANQLNRPFDEPDYLARPLRGRHFDGILGFGDAPYVRIYQGGLLVRETGSLEDLLPNRPGNSNHNHEGVYPQISVNCDRLRLLMDRKGIFEDRHLLDLVEASESALEGMHRVLLRRSFPIDGRNRWYLIRRKLRLRHLILAIMLIFLGVAAIPVLKRFTPIFEGPSLVPQSTRLKAMVQNGMHKPRTVDTIGQSLRRTIVDGRRSGGPVWDLQIDATDDVLLQVGVLTQFDPMDGFYFTPPQVTGSYPTPVDLENPVRVSLGLSGSRTTMVMPHPPGGTLKTSSVHLNGRLVEAVFEDAFGQPILRSQSFLKGTLTYEVAMQPRPSALADQRLQIPTNWPPEVARFLSDIASYDVSSRRHSIRQFVTQNFSYTRDPKALPEDGRAWIERVWQSRVGDCDVINGFQVLLLRASRIPAHLAVGLIVEAEQVSPTLHAWTMVRDGSWHHVDITQTIPTRIRNPQPPIDSASPHTTSPPMTQSQNTTPHTLSPTAIGRGLNLPAIGVAGIAITILALIFLASVRKRKPIPKLDPKYLELLMKKSFGEEGARDTLDLRFRPMFQTISGRRISVAELEKWCRHGPLMATVRHSQIPKTVKGRRKILDNSCSSLNVLRSFLPPIVDLDAYAFTLTPQPLPLVLQDAQNALRRMDPQIRLHCVPSRSGVEEVCIPFRKKHLGTNHLIVGLDTPVITSATRQYQARPELATFQILEWLLTHTTTYWRVRDATLSGWARQLLNDPKTNH